MKIKYNFGLLKKQHIGFYNQKTGHGFHSILVNVVRRSGDYHFQFEEGWDIVINEQEFLHCRLEWIDDYYCFTPDPDLLSPLLVYTMYDTFGFPMEMTQEIFEEKGLHVDIHGYHLLQELQRNRNSNTFKNKNAFKEE